MESVRLYLMAVISVALSMLCMPATAFAQTVTSPMVLSERDRLIVDLLDMALSLSAYDAQLVHSNTYYTQARLIEEVQAGRLDLMWASAANDTQAQLQAIKIPLFKGLLGYRVLLVEKSQQARIEAVSSLAQLRQFKAGLGHFWSDTQILEHAGLPVVKAAKAESLFYMLDGGRFDYLPLAVLEAWEVVETHPELNLAVASKVLLHYPQAMYLYVSKQNAPLYHAINEGLEMAIASGQFDRVFYNSDLIKTALARTDIATRKLIDIANPLLPHDAQTTRQALWLNINEGQAE